jgi:hypothetical protein
MTLNDALEFIADEGIFVITHPPFFGVHRRGDLRPRFGLWSSRPRFRSALRCL